MPLKQSIYFCKIWHFLPTLSFCILPFGISVCQLCNVSAFVCRFSVQWKMLRLCWKAFYYFAWFPVNCSKSSLLFLRTIFPVYKCVCYVSLVLIWILVCMYICVWMCMCTMHLYFFIETVRISHIIWMTKLIVTDNTTEQLLRTKATIIATTEKLQIVLFSFNQTSNTKQKTKQNVNKRCKMFDAIM